MKGGPARAFKSVVLPEPEGPSFINRRYEKKHLGVIRIESFTNACNFPEPALPKTERRTFFCPLYVSAETFQHSATGAGASELTPTLQLANRRRRVKIRSIILGFR